MARSWRATSSLVTFKREYHMLQQIGILLQTRIEHTFAKRPIRQLSNGFALTLSINTALQQRGQSIKQIILRWHEKYLSSILIRLGWSYVFWNASFTLFAMNSDIASFGAIKRTDITSIPPSGVGNCCTASPVVALHHVFNVDKKATKKCAWNRLNIDFLYNQRSVG